MARARQSVSSTDAEIARIRKSHKTLLVPITALTVRSDTPIADVDSIDALVAIAKAYDLKILEQPTQTAASYLIWDNGLIMRYRVGEGADSTPTSMTDDGRHSFAPGRPTWETASERPSTAD